MRIICRKCGSTMQYQGLGPSPDKGAALEFSCPCTAGIFLVVNEGEAMLVKSMGIKLAPGEAEPPFELARLSNPPPAGGLPWSPGAWERAQKIPETVRPMVIRAVVSFAESKSASEVSEKILDEFKSSKGYMG